MSEITLLNTLDFKSIVSEISNETIQIKVRKSGFVNGFCLTSVSTLTDKIILHDTDALNAPVYIPLPERAVKKGDILKFNVKYTFGGGFQNLTASFVE